MTDSEPFLCDENFLLSETMTDSDTYENNFFFQLCETSKNNFFYFSVNIWNRELFLIENDSHKRTKIYVCRKMVNSLWKSGRLQVFCKIAALQKFPKFTENHLWWSLLFNKSAIKRPVTFLKRGSGTRCFPRILS